MGDLKLISGNPGDAQVVAWPRPSNKSILLGTSGGAKVESGTNHVRSTHPYNMPFQPGKKIDCPQCYIEGCVLDGYDVPNQARTLTYSAVVYEPCCPSYRPSHSRAC